MIGLQGSTTESLATASRRDEEAARQPSRAVLAARRRRRARLRRNRLIGSALALLGLGTIWMTLGAADASSHHRSERPRVVLSTRLAAVRVVPGHLGPLAWPAKGQAAVAVLGTGLMAHSVASGVVPIASLTKMMTAYVVLSDHPLREGGEGPTFTIDAADVAAYVQADETDESNVPVQLGERLTEQQLLEALLIPSADNVANLLAIWDAGSLPAFVAKMNATAKHLGLDATHYADASGVNPLSSSDASDQALLAAMLMRNPVVRAIVSKPSLTFPVAGTIWNYNPSLGVDGIVGVKSGFTSRAEGCLATAAWRRVAGHSVLVVAVTLGQPLGLYQAAHVDEGLLDSAGTSLVGYELPVQRDELGDLVSGGAELPLALASPVPELVAWPGLRLHERLVARDVPPGAPIVGDLVLSASAGVLAKVPLSASPAASAATTS